MIDLETTGMDLRRDDIVSYGAVIVANDRIHCGRSTYRLVQPERPVSVASLTVHQPRQADLAGAPRIDDLLHDLIDLLDQRVLVAHEAWFEEAFLNQALRPARTFARPFRHRYPRPAAGMRADRGRLAAPVPVVRTPGGLQAPSHGPKVPGCPCRPAADGASRPIVPST